MLTENSKYPMRVIIIDDESKSRSALKNLLARYCVDVTVVSEAEGVKSGIEEIVKHQPDLIFLDIQLKDGTGFDLLKQAENGNFKIIFTTAYNEFAVKAFKFSAIDYLLKPINGKELAVAVEKTRQMVKKEDMGVKMNLLLSNNSSAEKRIILKTADSIYITNINDIVRCEADGNYTDIYLSDGKKILISKSLKEFDDLFSDQGFFRVHSAHLINLSYMERVKKTRGGEIFMKDNSHVPLAISRKQALMKILQEL